MDDDLLLERLRSVGYEAFARYYRELADRSISNANLVGRMAYEMGYTLNSARTRASVGRGIIRAGRGVDALHLIADSKNDRASIFSLAQLAVMESQQ